MNGHEQMKQLQTRFENEIIDAIYSSDLDRAVTTATALSKPRNLEINKNEMLREVDLGAWEDKAWGNLEYDEPEMLINFNNDPGEWYVEGSEPYEKVQERMLNFITEIGEKHEGETVAVFSHGFAIRSLMCKLLDAESHDNADIPYFDNTAVALLLYDNGSITVEYSGDNSHLSEEISTLARQTWWRDEDDRVKENLRYELIDSNSDNPDMNPTIKTIIEKVNFNLGYLAFLDNEPVGLLALDKADDTVGKIIYYYIKPEYRNRNFLEQLIGQSIASFRNLNKKNVQIIINPDDKNAISFLQKHGFNKIIDDDTLGILELKIV